LKVDAKASTLNENKIKSSRIIFKHCERGLLFSSIVKEDLPTGSVAGLLFTRTLMPEGNLSSCPQLVSNKQNRNWT
jgi:hypothetical protein